MGFNDQEIVALLGAHAVGRCHKDRSGFEGPWTYVLFFIKFRFSPTTFSNGYYKELFEKKWTVKKWNGPTQYEDESKSLMMLPTDMILLKDFAFKTIAESYAKDESLFFKDFAKAYVKLSELGCSNLSSKVLEFKRL